MTVDISIVLRDRNDLRAALLEPTEWEGGGYVMLSEDTDKRIRSEADRILDHVTEMADEIEDLRAEIEAMEMAL